MCIKHGYETTNEDWLYDIIELEKLFCGLKFDLNYTFRS